MIFTKMLPAFHKQPSSFSVIKKKTFLGYSIVGAFEKE